MLGWREDGGEISFIRENRKEKRKIMRSGHSIDEKGFYDITDHGRRHR